MRLYSHFSFQTLSNTYLMGPRTGGDAVLIDPATFDVPLLELIEQMGYYVRNVLLTHVADSHLAGLTTLRKIYDCTVYAAQPNVVVGDAIMVQNAEVLEIWHKPIEVIALPGHGGDSVAYYTGGFVFTGSAMSAAEYGHLPNAYAKALLHANVWERVLTLPDETVIMPFFGPPSTVALEKVTFPVDDPTLPSAPA